MSDVERKLAEHRAKKKSKAIGTISFWKSLFTQPDSKLQELIAREKLLSDDSDKEENVDTVDSPYEKYSKNTRKNISDVEGKLAEDSEKKKYKHTETSSFWKSLFTQPDSKIEELIAREKILSDDSDEEKNVDTVHSPYQEDAMSFNSDIDDSAIDCCTYTDMIYYSVWFMLWVILWAIFIKLQFGTVYFILSGLIGIYLNTRTRPKERGEVSAYSVFNKDCKSIDGTLKAEQFEREIRYGPSSMH